MGAGADLIAEYGQLYTVTRYGAGSWVKGENVPGATTTFEVMMSIQPLNGTELLNLPEAQRTRRTVKAYAADRLFTAEQSLAAKADRVAYDGRVFEVQDAQNWTPTDLDHWKCVLAEVNPS